MREVGAFEAKTHLSELLAAVEQGEEIRITHRGRPVARIVPDNGHLDTDATLAELLRLRETLRNRVTGEDILSARDEGRR